ncbi:MAG: FlgD immunoglobulin-like domain containing protein [Candidatus Zixiibacteriota bacterium]
MNYPVNIGNLDRGYHTVTWDGKDQSGKTVSSGIYFYSITYRSGTQVKKMVLLK